jgi:CubicO group peptidase (beta-lactamase class C family)
MLLVKREIAQLLVVKCRMSKDTNARIKRITSNLCPATAFAGKFGAPQTLRDQMARYHTPGVSIAVINDFKIEWAQGFGVCDVRSKDKVTNQTLFQAGSISKPIFALGVMRLVQEGKLDIDEDINQYLSAWRVPGNDGWQPRITLRQLLSHTAGLTVHGFPGYQASETVPTVPQILSGAFPANTPKVEVNILPGTQFRYSGGGTTVGQQVLVDVLGKSFPKIMRELILEPFGLTNSTYEQPLSKRWAKKAATAHPSKSIPLKGKFHTYPEMAAAGLWTTATDLATVGVELMRALHEKKKHPILTKETIEAMLLPQLAHQKAGEGEFVGLGFFCAGKDDGFHFGHGGWDEGFVANVQFYPNIGKGVVVMINSNEGHPIIGEIMQAIAKEYEWPDAVPLEKTVMDIASIAGIDNYVGVYATKDAMQFHIRASDIGDNLMLQYGEQPALPIFASSEVEFFAKVINASIAFEKIENIEKEGKAEIVSLTISQGSNQIKADKQVAPIVKKPQRRPARKSS